VDFPDGGLCEHHKSESGVGEQGSGPAIVGAVESRSDLVKIIGTSCFPFENVVLENVVTVGKGVRVTICLQVLRAVCSVNVGIVAEVNVIAAVRWFESHVVVAWRGILPEVANWHRQQLLG